MTNKFSREGNINLTTVDEKDNFTNWMYGEIKPYLKGNILEVGSGLGTYSNKIIKDFKDSKIILSDIDSEYVEKLKNKYKDNRNVSTIKLDLSDPSDFNKIKSKINSVFALNVLEHIKKDILAFRNVYNLLEPGGRFIILVPAHKFLYNCIDRSIGHHRRYTKKNLKKRIARTDFLIEDLFYFNSASIVGWYINGNLLKKELVNENAVSLFNKIVPILKPTEKYVLRKKIGISLIAVLKKPK